MFAAVPCYNLRKRHMTVADDMPQPRTLRGSWREMRQIWKKQRADPGYQYETPLPGRKDKRKGKDASLESSIGDLAARKFE